MNTRVYDYIAARGNPRYYQCMLDEDMIRRVLGRHFMSVFGPIYTAWIFDVMFLDVFGTTQFGGPQVYNQPRWKIFVKGYTQTCSAKGLLNTMLRRPPFVGRDRCQSEWKNGFPQIRLQGRCDTLQIISDIAVHIVLRIFIVYRKLQLPIYERHI